MPEFIENKRLKTEIENLKKEIENLQNKGNKIIKK